MSNAEVEMGQPRPSRSPIIRITSAQSLDSNCASKTVGQQEPPETARESAGQAASGAGTTSIKMVRISSNELGHLETSSAANKQQSLEATHAYKARWFVLAIFCTHSAVNSFQWIQYSSITNIVSLYYGVSNLAVNLTSLVYMITYIPFIIHASLMLERVGLRYAICLGAAGTALGSLVKLLLAGSPSQLAFVGLMAGQTIVALSQLYIISIPPLLAAVWFPDNQVSTATGIGVFGNQLGIALGFIMPPLVISNPNAGKERVGDELYLLSLGVAMLSIAICLIACLFLRDKPPKPPGSASLHAANQQQHQHQQLVVADINGNTIGSSSNSQSPATPTTSTNSTVGQTESFATIRELCRDKDFKLLTLSYGINVGCFYSVSTLLNQMLARTWPQPDDLAGTSGLLIVVSGMAGSVMCGQLLDRTHAYKLIIVSIYFMSLVSMAAFALVLRLTSSQWILCAASTLLGFFMTGYLPLGFEFAAEITYPQSANTPAGLLNLSAQVSRSSYSSY